MQVSKIFVRPLLANRTAVYQAAKEKNPSRWSGNTRNWERKNEVALNPTNATEVNDKKTKKKA